MAPVSLAAEMSEGRSRKELGDTAASSKGRAPHRACKSGSAGSARVGNRATVEKDAVDVSSTLFTESITKVAGRAG